MKIPCRLCGGDAVEERPGEYRCLYCGGTFLKADERPQPTEKVGRDGDAGADVYEDNVGGVLELSCSGSDGTWSGSGYIITGDGYAVTNAHVAADDGGAPCDEIRAKVIGKSVRASVVALADDRAGHGRGNDLALIKLERMPVGAKALKLADSSAVRNGETVFAVGNSLGAGTCIVRGIVSDRARKINGKTMIMNDCQTNPGNSGGPLFNKQGEVIGTVVSHALNSDGTSAAGMRYAIPSNTVKEFADKHIKSKL